VVLVKRIHRDDYTSESLAQLEKLRESVGQSMPQIGNEELLGVVNANLRSR